MGLVCHPELRNRVGTWGFKGEVGNSQEGKSRCLVNQMFARPCSKSFRLKKKKKVITDNCSLSVLLVTQLSEALMRCPEISKEEATAGCGEGRWPVLATSTSSRIPPDRPPMAMETPRQETPERGRRKKRETLLPAPRNTPPPSSQLSVKDRHPAPRGASLRLSLTSREWTFALINFPARVPQSPCGALSSNSFS